jgi:molecular chaperone HscB
MKLRLQGAQTEKDDEKTIEDPELLMEVMEAREEVEGATDEASLRGLLAVNASGVESCVKELSAAFEGGNNAAAVALTQRLTYLIKIQNEIIQKL